MVTAEVWTPDGKTMKIEEGGQGGRYRFNQYRVIIEKIDTSSATFTVVPLAPQ
jgi:hypothetical protein